MSFTPPASFHPRPTTFSGSPNPFVKASLHRRSSIKTMPGALDSFDEASLHRRSSIKTIPGALDPFDEEMNDPQKLSNAPKAAGHQQTASTQTAATETPYMDKLKAANEAPTWDNIRAALFSWLTLAGYVVLPGAFTSLKTSQALAASHGGKIIQDTIKNTPFQWIAGLCCLFGTVGTSWLWYVWRNNAIWLVAHIFLPGLLHSFIGLITTLINVYTAQGGHWSVTAKITIIVIGICTGNMSVLYLVYDLWVVENMKKSHARALARQSHA